MIFKGEMHHGRNLDFRVVITSKFDDLNYILTDLLKNQVINVIWKVKILYYKIIIEK